MIAHTAARNTVERNRRSKADPDDAETGTSVITERDRLTNDLHCIFIISLISIIIPSCLSRKVKDDVI